MEEPAVAIGDRAQAAPRAANATDAARIDPTVQRKPLRVMQITYSLVAGGSEIYALTLASNLEPTRFTSLMCAIDQGGKLEPEIDRLGIARFVMNRRQTVDWRLMPRMWRLFGTSDVDVIHTHHFNQIFYTALAARLRGIRVIHTEHDIAQFKHSRKLRVALRVLSMFCDRVVAVGVEVEEFLRDRVGIPQRKLCVVRAGVKLAGFDGTRADARRELDLADSDRAAVIVARLSPEKGHRLLLAAFAQVAGRVPTAKLLIVGEGPEETAIRQEIARLALESKVRMLGVRRDVPKILSGCDLFVLSSEREGLPIAVLEAMAAGKPVVATNVGDLHVLVRDGETGRLVPPADAAALADGMCDLLADPARSNALGQTARDFVAGHFSLDAMVAAHEAMYRGV
jgi:glycosyltransferase involved in cell wall biosynthesis